MKNIASAGDLNGPVCCEKGKLFIATKAFQRGRVYIDKTTVQEYQVVGETDHISVGSAVARGAVGAMVNPLGALVGIATAKKKGIHSVAIIFTDGRKLLIDLDDEYYKTFSLLMM